MSIKLKLNFKQTNMKSILTKTLTGLLISSMFFSCSSDDDSSNHSNLNRLREVRFSIPPDKEVSAKFTGKTAKDAKGIMRKEYEVTTSSATAFSRADLMHEAPIEETMLYPGSILRGESFMKGKYDPLVLKNSFNPVTLFLTIKGVNREIKKDVVPKGSEVFQALSDFRVGNSEYFPIKYVSANYTYKSEEVTTEESFKKSINLHVKAGFSLIAKASFGYDYSQSKVKSSHYVLVRLKQTVYSAGIDPVHWSNWVQGDISSSDSGPYEPVYISSIDYGRVAYILVETQKSTEETAKMVKASIDLKIGGFFSDINREQNEEFKKLFDSNKVNVSVLGGPSEIVNNYEDFINYMKLSDNKESLISTSAPISYTIRRLKDNTLVDMVNTYEEVHKEYR